MTTQYLNHDDIKVPDYVERPFSKIQDSRDTESIRTVGIQQPLVCVRDGNARLLLADGLRRLRIARSLNLPKVPILVAPVPAGYDCDTYIRELRLALDVHRQDLVASQKAQLIETLKERFGMNNKQVAAFLGCDQDSVTNWMAVRSYIPEVVTAMDAGEITMQMARCFDGMSEKGQRRVLRDHGELIRNGRGSVHKEIRELYPPEENPTFYRNAALTAKRLAQKKRPKGERPTATRAEKRRLEVSLDMKERELDEGRIELERLKKEIEASISPLSAILRSEKLRSMIPKEMDPELERFGEIYL